MVCQAGAERYLKAELALAHPELHFAYSRPGFVTFKWEPGKRAPGAPAPNGGFPADYEIHSIFARAHGLSFGKAQGDPVEALRAWIDDLGLASGAPRLHVFERETFVPGEEPLGFVRGAHAARAREAIVAALPGRFAEGEVARTGDTVIDVIVVDPEEWWLGLHVQTAAHSPYPGGAPRIELPPEAPSRAYLKIEEALLWTGNPIRRGDTAVEIGSAPGGASYALLKRGLRVVGIDPAEMDPRVLALPGFSHVREPIAGVRTESLPESIQWLLLDMNVAPNVILNQVERLSRRLMGSLLGVYLTLKMNDPRMVAEIPKMIEHVRSMGMARVRARQLASNKREIAVFGLTKKGMAR